MTRWTWTAADGTVTELHGATAWAAGSYVLADGTSGHLAPAYEFQSQTYAGVDGAVLQQVTPQPAAPILAVDIVGAGGVSLAARVRGLAHALRPRAGAGTLTAVGDDGTVRTLPCYYRKGLESGVYRDARFRAALEFWAPSPWWRGTPLTVSWALAGARAFFPLLPMYLSPSTISGQVTVDLSDTDSQTFPQWTVTGPGDQITLTNDTVGRSLVLPVPGGIGDGQLVIIDTRPGFQSIRRATPGATTMQEQRRNLVPNPAPASATGYTANYGTGGAGALSYTGSGGPAGGGYVRATWSTASTAAGTGQVRFDGRAAQPLPMPVTPGQVISASCWARSSIAQRLAAQVTYFDAAGAQTGITPTGHAGPQQVLTANTWTRLAVENVTVPTGAAYALVGPQAAAGTGAVVWPIGATLDQALTTLEVAATAGDYFDGATTSTATVIYAWTGTANASPSTQSVVVAVGNPVLGASLFGSLTSDPAMWPLLDGVNSVTVTLTNAGPASRIALAADRLYSGAL